MPLTETALVFFSSLPAMRRGARIRRKFQANLAALLPGSHCVEYRPGAAYAKTTGILRNLNVRDVQDKE